MIKCGKLKGKDDEVAEQCILFTEKGKPLGYFLYSEHGGEAGAKKAATKRSGQVQAFEKVKKAMAVYMFDKLEKARGKGQGVGGERQGDGGADQCVCPKCGATTAHEKGTPCAEQKCPKCGATMTGQSAEKSVEKAKEKKLSSKEVWEKEYGGSHKKCVTIVSGRGVKTPEAYCAWLKDKLLGTTKWRGKGKKPCKSFEEETEDALTLLEKHDEDEEMELDNIDLSELEAWLSGEEAADMESEPTETEPEPEPADAEPEPTAEPEPEPEEEQPLDFRTFLLRDHARRRAEILAALGEEVEDNG